MTLVLTGVAAVLIGAVLGLLGGGGSILVVPLLLYVTGLPTDEAITTSLFVVGVTAAVAVIPHARAGRVRWRTGLLFGLAGMVGAYAGGRLAGWLPSVLLLTLFGLLMLAAAVVMIRRGRAGAVSREQRKPQRAARTQRPERAPRTQGTAAWLRLGALGAGVGLLTGLVGAGGGFVIVPALTLMAGLAMGEAVGTSLLVIAMQATAGLLGHLGTAQVPWPLALGVAGLAVLGSVAGAALSGRVSQPTLRTTFGWFLVAMSTLVLVQQLPIG